MNIQIKKSWDEVTIHEYIQFRNAIETIGKIVENSSPDEIGEYITDFNVKVLSIFSNLSEDEIFDMPAIEIDKLNCNLNFLTEQPKISKAKEEFTIGGEKFVCYGMMDRLKSASISSLKTIQYIDSMGIYSDVPDTKKINNLPKLLTILLHRVGHPKYNEAGFSSSENEKMILEGMSIVDALTVEFFFSKTYNSLIEAIKIYSNRKRKKN